MAVYTPVDQESLCQFLDNYDIGEWVDHQPIQQGVENSNFHLFTTKGRYILTLFEKRVNESDLPFFLGLKNHLRGQGFPCPAPILTNAKGLYGTLCQRPSAIVEFLNGQETLDYNTAQLFELGTHLALLHQKGQGFSLQRKNNLSIDGWPKLYQDCADSLNNKPNEAQNHLQILKDSLDVLNANWPKDLPFGICHADLFPNNVFFDDNKLTGVIDFYFACNDFFAYDIIITLNSWCFDGAGENFSPPLAEAFIQGYQSIRKLTDAEINAMGILAQGAAIRFYLTRLYDWINHSEASFVIPHDPQTYARILKFHQENPTLIADIISSTSHL